MRRRRTASCPYGTSSQLICGEDEPYNGLNDAQLEVRYVIRREHLEISVDLSTVIEIRPHLVSFRGDSCGDAHGRRNEDGISWRFKAEHIVMAKAKKEGAGRAGADSRTRWR